MQIGAMIGQAASVTAKMALPVACLGALVAVAVYIGRDLWKPGAKTKAAAR
jgi:hypothetical protein